MDDWLEKFQSILRIFLLYVMRTSMIMQLGKVPWDTQHRLNKDKQNLPFSIREQLFLIQTCTNVFFFNFFFLQNPMLIAAFTTDIVTLSKYVPLSLSLL